MTSRMLAPEYRKQHGVVMLSSPRPLPSDQERLPGAWCCAVGATIAHWAGASFENGI